MNIKYPKANIDKLVSIAGVYVASLDELYGHYLDTAMGFVQITKMIEGIQVQMRANGIGLSSNPNLDDLPFSFGAGSPLDPNNRLQHTTTQGEIKRRNLKGGRNHVRAAQLLIVLIYSFWEEEYRSEFAQCLGLTDKNELKLPLFGEIRLLRNDVIHHHRIITKDTATKLAIFGNAKEGVELVLSERMVEELVRHLKAAIDDLVVQAGGQDPNYRTIWQIK